MSPVDPLLTNAQHKTNSLFVHVARMDKPQRCLRTAQLLSKQNYQHSSSDNDHQQDDPKDTAPTRDT